MWTRDDVHADDFAFDGFNRLCAGVDGGFHCGDVADDDRGYEGIADLRHGAGEFDIRSLEHCVGALDERDEAARFDESN